MAGVAEENRRRLAGFLCLLGLILILVGVGVTVKYQWDYADFSVPASKLPDNKAVAKILQAVLFLVLVLICVFGICTLAFLRWSRRFRRYLLSRPRPATPVEDIWVKHRLPGDAQGGQARPQRTTEE